jgi:ferredoxin
MIDRYPVVVISMAHSVRLIDRSRMVDPGAARCQDMTVRKRLWVDPRLCEGHALCLESAPEVFDLSDDDVAECVKQPSDELWDQVSAAIDACPRGAISLIDDPKGQPVP